MNLVGGCDPGLSGAIAFFDQEGNVLMIIDIPVLTKANGRRFINIAELKTKLPTQHQIKAFWIEDIWAFPGRANNSSFTFGRALGNVEAVAATLDWPLTYVTPVKWKKTFGLGKDKEESRLKASQLLPNFVHHWTVTRGQCTKEQAYGRAEAALIAYWGLHYGGSAALL